MGETREELLARLEQLNAAETESYIEPRAELAKPGKFKTFSFGDSTVEVEIKPFIQPQNDPDSDPDKFVIGTKEKRGSYRQALPFPRWPRPGQIATDEERAENEEAFHLWMQSAQALSHVLWCQQRKRGGEDLYAWDNGRTGARMDKEWAWLTGLWQSRRMQVPDLDELTDQAYGKAKR